MNGDGAWGGRIVLDEGGGLFLGQGGETPLHAHNSFKLVIPLDGFARIVTTTRGPLRGPIQVVRPNEPHVVQARGCYLALVYVEPQSRLGRCLHTLEREDEGRWASAEADALIESLSARRSARLPTTDELLSDLAKRTRPEPLDGRIRRVIERIDRDLCAGVPVAEIATSVALSASRLSHIFAEALGTPLVRYRRWQHLRRAMALLATGKGVTNTAHATGFSDAAHMCRSFVQMMGITPGVFAGMQLDQRPEVSRAQRIRSML